MKKKQKLFLPYIICSVAASFYIYDYILRVMPEAMTHSLMRDFNINAAGLGLLASLFFWGYAPMQIPVGIIFDKFSARLILTIAIFCSSIATLAFGLTDSYILACIARFIMGITTSFAFVGALVVGANWFRGKYFAFYTGLVQFLGCMGAIIGITPILLLTEHHGRAYTNNVVAIAGFTLAALVWLIVRDAPKSEIKRQRKRILTKKPPSYRKVFANPQTWFVGLYGFAIWAPITVFATLWGVPFLHDVYQLSNVNAGSQVSIIWFSIAFGGPLVGWLSNHLKMRRLPMIVCAILGIVSSSIIIEFSTLSQTMLAILLVLLGLGASGLVLAFGLVVDLQPPETIGTVVGFTNMAVILGGVILQPIVGFILKHLQNDFIVGPSNVHIYSHHAYRIALIILPASFLLALITSFFVKETHCKKLYKY